MLSILISSISIWSAFLLKGNSQNELETISAIPEAASNVIVSRQAFYKQLNLELFKKIFGSLPLVAIIFAAIIIRIVAAGESQGYVHPDEVFQSIEMVHFRIFGKFGNGQTIPWEYDLDHPYGGARSWFFVFILVAIYKFFMLFGITNPLTLIFIARLFLSLSSIITVLVSYFFGKEMFNKTVGLLSAFLCGVWWFFPFWASRTMTDSLSSDFLFMSIFLAYKVLKSKDSYKRKFILSLLSGFFVGLAFMIRFPTALMGFPLLVFFLFVAIKEIIDRRKKKISDKQIVSKFLLFTPAIGFTLGSFFMVLVQGIFDMLTWGSFLHSPINFFLYNIVEGYSALHGTSPWYSYFTGFYTNFAEYFLPIFLMFFIIGLSYKEKTKSKIMIGSIIVFWLLVFSILAHKEFRFIMVILPLCFLFIANGIYKVVIMFRKKKYQVISLASILLIFVTASSVMAFIEKDWMWKFNSGICNAMYWVGQQDKVDTVIAFEMVWYTGGYVYLDRNVTCFFSRINTSLPPEYTYNNTYFLNLYSQKGTFVIILQYHYHLVEPVVTEYNMSLLANVYGIPNAYVFGHL